LWQSAIRYFTSSISFSLNPCVLVFIPFSSTFFLWLLLAFTRFDIHSRDHLTLRTRIKRLARKSICFSKDKIIHETVIASFINIFYRNRNLPTFN
ncbi:MAG: hypothetical protein J6B75_01565, partial [Ruminococcus sp.]|nr:hypothetical protein [Ruminococcus sp.]